MSFRRGLLLFALASMLAGIGGAQTVGLLHAFGNGQAVRAGTSFGLGVRAIGNGQVPQAGVRVFVASVAIFGPTLECDESVTGPDGLGVVVCNVGSWPFTTAMIITLGDDLGRLSPPFNVLVNPLTLNDGLTKFQGDRLRVPENSSFDLGVQAAINGGPQIGIPLDIEVSPLDAPVECPLSVETGETGQALIRCDTEAIDFQTAVEITVRDRLGRSVSFSVTIVKEDLLTDGIFKFSGDDQAVPAGAPFPLDMVAQAITNGRPHGGLRLTITNSAPSIVFCPNEVITDSNGQARIGCQAGATATNLFVAVRVRDQLGRSLADPFRVSVIQRPLQTASRLDLVSRKQITVDAGDTVTDAIRVRAFTRDGVAAHGVLIFFSSRLNVAFDPPIAITGANGEAGATVTFGCPGDKGVIAAGLQQEVRNVTVGVDIGTGGTSRLRKLQGDLQSGPPLTRLDDEALVVQLSDTCINPIVRQPISWTVEPPDAATLEDVFDTTNGEGKSSVLVRLGTSDGPFVVRASHGELQAVFNLSVDLTPTELSIPEPPRQTIPRGGLSEPLVVRLRDARGVGISRETIRFAIAQGGGELTETEVQTNSEGHASTRLRAAETPGTVTVVASLVVDEAAAQNGKTPRLDQTALTATFQLVVGGRKPLADAGGVVNGASFEFGLAPGALASIFGTSLSEGIDGTVAAGSSPLPTDIEGTKVRINGVEAPLFSVSNTNGQGQINLHVPFEFGEGRVPVEIENNGSITVIPDVMVHTIQPAIFEVDILGTRYAAALHSDFRLVGPTDPARPGEVILLFLTGLGHLLPSVATNQPGPVPAAATGLTPQVGIDNGGAETFGGFYAPGLISVYQVNFRVPTDVATGNRDINVVIGGETSQRALLPVRR